jgi:polysaccharide biosynthesis transport protein
MSIQSYTMQDYVSAFRRRFGLFGLTFAAVVAVAAAAAVMLPDVYRSSSQIRVDLEGNVDLLEPVMLTNYADQYIRTLEQRALSYSNLRDWLHEGNLFADERDEFTEDELVSRMRNGVRVSMVTTEVVDPRSGRGMNFITGFTVGYEAKDPDTAYFVADKMAAAFLAEDRATRTQRAATATGFLREQIEFERERITDLEGRIAMFKELNAGSLPEMMGANLAALERTERDLEGVQAELRTLEQDRIFRQSQLEELRLRSGSAVRLAQLEEEYMRALALYGPDHPDVIRISRQVAALTGSGGTASSTNPEIALLEVELAEARQRYSDIHPDVRSLERRIQALRAQDQGGSSGRAEMETNPAYLQLRAQINAIDTRMQGLRARSTELRGRLETLQHRLDTTPQVERDYAVLNRDLQTATIAFNDLRGRLAQAEQTESFEAGERGARLELVSNASLPRFPSGPPRLGILLIGFFLAGTVASGVAISREGLDQTVRGAVDIRTLFQTQPIALIPVVQNSVSQSKRRQRLAMVAIIVAVIVTAAVLLLSRVA